WASMDIPEGASRQRGRFELAFSQIGGAVMTGAFLVVFKVFMEDINKWALQNKKLVYEELSNEELVLQTHLELLLLCTVAWSSIFMAARSDDEVNTIAAGTATGLLYKSSGGIKKCGIGGALGFGLTSLYCLWTSKDRLKQMVHM
ncbi:mitochondrial import inner membrane translocase subunit Tim23, partial [Trichonephila clavata]